jgi:hypothetical protein
VAKNRNTMKKDVPAASLPYEPVSSLGKRVAAAGGALVLSGFALLAFADPLGRNLPALISPFLLIGGYAAIGAGLFLPPTSPSA